MVAANPSLPKGMRHVQRKELYTSFDARLKYLHSFIEFGSADIDALRSSQSFIKTLIPTVAELVYNKLLENDLTAQALTTQTTKKDSELDEDEYYTKGSKNVKNRHMFVRWYLTKLNGDPTRPEYWEYMNQVGAMHNGHERRQPLTVDLIHFSMMIGHVQNILNESILLHPGLDLQQKVALIKAWGKLIWIQNDLFSKWHVKDGEEYEQTGHEAMKLSRKDRKQDREDSMFRDDEGRPIECPFSALAQMRLEEALNGKVKNAYVYNGKSTIGSIESIHSPPPLSP